MKKIILLFLVVCTIIACHSSSTIYKVPEGYKPCKSDNDCNIDQGEYCGFVRVDTYAVCKQ